MAYGWMSREELRDEKSVFTIFSNHNFQLKEMKISMHFCVAFGLTLFLVNQSCVIFFGNWYDYSGALIWEFLNCFFILVIVVTFI